MDKIKIIKTEVEELLKKLIDKFEVEVSQEGESYQVIIKAEEEAPTVIGRHGETIRAIQKILEVVLYKKFGEPLRLLVNVNDYREKQKEKLELMVSQLADKVRTTKQSTQVQDLSSYERKVIHEFITANYPELTSYSVGEGRERNLVIDLKENEPTKSSTE
ncbi:hypothetical protein COS31_03365 [Candidatus Roizmanbacteria bacterium CG02_land_8_20_14_3_00_36_15]|uniref:R3H domain-containing protein n=2 Tax=Candidatus Roizmaniibacteriota TaxID=1752723 RepID=A0A2M8KLH7_9BACT|nr:MAG: hypothetical protein COS51_03425 [Candidatus Roizmanbacteria bacterium CG03_land_8_20_14_0_80_36_21]PIV37716.1 MAG: hypothetical protein COS31_03365 [Candidatus Roizmanbacteria bacterium CG02_land_8_20_14_3_00_36_15]PIY69673.1 MAG: hypothetical protein COY89_05370 [Candidatus Roizmanbacteria bacterium CG_4_10_14_0_8_um_filter_36_36]PJA53546.1 MAG: hypothetical protein CO166_01580 [Candidatus Roizmanbacteria bacterium CG_4_9_14_3_um_filter_36_11]PJC81824.1 MAG: hypothetical protein CO007